MIGTTSLNSFMQRVFWTKDIKVFSFSIRDIEKTLAPRSITNLTKKLLTKYHDFFNVFSCTDSDKLLPHYLYDYKISLMEGKTLLWEPLYSMSQDELKCLKKYIEEYLDMGFIRASSSPATSQSFLLVNQEVACNFALIIGNWMLWLSKIDTHYF